MLTGRQILDVLKDATDEQLDDPVQIEIKTYTSLIPFYPEAWECQFKRAGVGHGLRIYANFPKGIIISRR